MSKYWYIFLLTILVASSSNTLDRATKKWIPDDLKRAKFYQGVLFTMALLYGIIMFIVTKDTFALPLSLFLSGFPIVCVTLGTLYAYFKHKHK